MVTQSQIISILDDNSEAYKTEIDHDSEAILLFKKRLPYDKFLIEKTDTIIYLCDLELAAKYLLEEDLPVLLECNVWVSGNKLALYIKQ